MTGKFTAACVQISAQREFAPNIEATSALIRRARDAGADLIMTPEITGMFEPKRDLHLAKARDEAGNPALAAFRELARETGAWLLIGSLAIKLEAARLANRSFLIAPDGAIAARYDKIHMFDVDLVNGESYRESALYRPGDNAILAALPWGTLGMTVCYDLRFPALYRTLAHAGADFLSIPAAFTVPTGKAHWHVLQRARAIENGCFVFAPAQCGEHAEGRKTYGHSLIVDPWGEVLADAGEAIGFNGPGATARPGHSRAATVGNAARRGVGSRHIRRGRQSERLCLLCRRDALDDGWFGALDDALLERDDAKRGPENREQLAGTEEKFRVARPAEALVSDREGLVNENAPWRERGDQRREQRAVQIVGDDDAVIASAQRPGRTVFQIEHADCAQGITGEGGEPRGVAIGGDHGKAAIAQQAGMPAVSGGEVEDTPARADQRDESAHPRRGRRGGMDVVHRQFAVC